MDDSVETKYRFSLKSSSGPNKPPSASTERPAPHHSVLPGVEQAGRVQSCSGSTRTGSAARSGSRGPGSAISVSGSRGARSAVSASGSRGLGSAVSASGRRGPGSAVSASGSRGPGSAVSVSDTRRDPKERAKSSIGVTRRNTNLSDILSQHSSIGVRGRPLSAPGSEVAELPPGGTALTHNTHRQASATRSFSSSSMSSQTSKAAVPTNKTDNILSPSHRITPTSNAPSRASRRLSAKTPKSASTSRPNVKTPVVKAASNANNEKKPAQDKNTLFAQKTSTPFWFYRSKTDVLLQPEDTHTALETTDSIRDEPSKKMDEPVISPRQQMNPKPGTSLASPRQPGSPRNNKDDKIHKPNSMIPKIYVFDSYYKRFLACGGETPRTPRSARSEHEPEVDETVNKPEEVVDLLRRNHVGADSRCAEVMRTLPLQTELERYTWWLQADKRRDGSFTASMNRFVPGFFQVSADKPPVTSSNSPGHRVLRSHPKSAPPVVMDLSPAPSAFMTETSEPTAQDASVSKGLAVDTSA